MRVLRCCLARGVQVKCQGAWSSTLACTGHRGIDQGSVTYCFISSEANLCPFVPLDATKLCFAGLVAVVAKACFELMDQNVCKLDPLSDRLAAFGVEVHMLLVSNSANSNLIY